MGLQDRLRESLTGGSGGSDPPEYRCNGCQGRFNSNQSPRHASCPDCDSDDVELLANPDHADGSHPLDPRSDDDDAGDSGDAEAAPADPEATPADATADASSGETETASDATPATDAAAETASADTFTESVDDAVDEPDDSAADEQDDEAAAVRELMQTGQYRCQDCREAFDTEGPDLICPDCGSTDIEERF